MDSGFFKLYRKFLEWEWYSDIPTKVLYLHILLKANHSDKKWRGIPILKGQFLSSNKKLASQTGLSLQQIRTSLRKLSRSEITVKPTNKFTVIAVCNYLTYNDQEQTNNKQTTNKQQTNNIQSTTTKNKKNKENKEKEYSESFEDFWNAYEKLGSKKKSYDQFKKLSEQQKNDIRQVLSEYVRSTNTDGTYPSRKNAETYLNYKNEHWNDIILKTNGGSSNIKTASQVYDEMLGN